MESPCDASSLKEKGDALYPDEGIVTWANHILSESQVTGPKFCFRAIPTGADDFVDPACTVAEQCALARLVRRNTRKKELEMFNNIPHDAPNVGTLVYLAVMRQHRMRGPHAVMLANAELQDPQRSTENITAYYSRLQRGRRSLLDLGRDVNIITLIDAFKAGVSSMHSSWAEDIESENTTEDQLEYLVYNKGLFRENAAKKSNIASGPSALAASAANDALDLKQFITDTVARAFAAHHPSEQRRQGAPNNRGVASTCWYCNKAGHRRADCKQRIRDQKSGKHAPSGGDANEGPPAAFPAFGCAALASFEPPAPPLTSQPATAQPRLSFRPRLTAPPHCGPHGGDTGNLVWDWMTCKWVDPVAHPAILDHKLDPLHGIVYASIADNKHRTASSTGLGLINTKKPPPLLLPRGWIPRRFRPSLPNVALDDVIRRERDGLRDVEQLTARRQHPAAPPSVRHSHSSASTVKLNHKRRLFDCAQEEFTVPTHYAANAEYSEDGTRRRCVTRTAGPARQPHYLRRQLKRQNKKQRPSVTISHDLLATKLTMDGHGDLGKNKLTRDGHGDLNENKLTIGDTVATDIKSVMSDCILNYDNEMPDHASANCDSLHGDTDFAFTINARTVHCQPATPRGGGRCPRAKRSGLLRMAYMAFLPGGTKMSKAASLSAYRRLIRMRMSASKRRGIHKPTAFAAFMATHKDIATAAAATAQGIKKWAVDSGANFHFDGAEEEFEHMDPFSGHVSGLDVEIKGKGTVRLALADCHGKVHSILLHDVLYVPGIAKRSGHNFLRLFSVNAATAKGWSVTFGSPAGDIITHNKSGVSFPLTKDQGLSWIHSVTPPPAIAATAAGTISKDLLHRRLGHLHDAGLSKLASLGCNGIPTELAKTPISFCEQCHTCKSKVADINRDSDHCSDPEQPFESLAVDIWGPMKISAIGGYSWVLGAACFTTAYVLAGLMRTKDEAPAHFEAFLIKIRSLGFSVRTVRVDNDSVLLSDAFRATCTRWRINPDRTAPYSAFQLARIERQWRTLREMAACMVSYASLPMCYWGYAFISAVYIRNRVWSQGSNGIPYLTVTGKQPDLNLFRIFGSPAYVHIDSSNRRKFEDTAWKGIMVGYCSDSPAYLIYNPRSRNILRSRNVTFDENWIEQTRSQLPRRLNSGEDGHDGIESTDNIRSSSDNQQTPSPTRGEAATASSDRAVTRNSARSQLLETRRKTIGNEVDRAMGITDPAERHAAILELLGDAENDRDSLIHRLTENASIPSTHLGTDSVALVASADEPASYKKAVSGEHSDNWAAAIKREYDSHILNNTWTLVTCPQNARVIGNMWRFKIKRDADGQVVKFKARLCARGDQQTDGVDYNETFAPTVRYTTLRVLLALACHHDLEVEQFDVVTAFLNADVAEDIYMQQPEGFVQLDPQGRRLVCKLNRAIYGIKQAPRAWNTMVTTWLDNYGFTQSRVDPGIYTCVNNGHLYVLAIYVDDCLLIGRKGPFIIKFKLEFGEAFKIEDLGPVSWLLGCSIERDRPHRVLHVRQRQYIIDILDLYNMADCTAIGTPMSSKPPLIDSPDEDISSDRERPYAQMVGKLLYLANCTRPDIAAATSHLSRFMSKPTQLHWVQAKRVLRYLSGTKDLCLTYSGDVSTDPIFWQDASYADGHERKSRTGLVAMMCGGAVLWAVRLQPTTALSTVEAEYMALAAAAQECGFLRQLLMSLGIVLNSPTRMYEDNMGCISLANNSMTTGKTKHIDIRYHFIRDMVKSGVIQLVWCRTEDMVADALTKFSLPTALHVKHVGRMMSGTYKGPTSV